MGGRNFQRCFDGIPADTFASRHSVGTRVAVDVVGHGGGLGVDKGHVKCNIVSCRGISLPVEEIVAGIGIIWVDVEEDRGGALSRADNMSIVVVPAENLHFDVICGSVDFVLSGAVEANVVHFPVDLMVLVTLQGLSSVESATVSEAAHLVDPVREAGGADLDFLVGCWEVGEPVLVPADEVIVGRGAVGGPVERIVDGGLDRVLRSTGLVSIAPVIAAILIVECRVRLVGGGGHEEERENQ